MAAAGSGRLIGAQLGEYAVGRFRMQEGNEFSGSALKGFLMDQAHAGSCGLRQLAGDVIGTKSDVMNSLAAIGQELGNGTFRRRRLEQFQVNASDIEERRTHLLGRDLLAVLTTQSKRFFINGHGLIERANRDAKVIDVINHF
jgi:hypothetical protein